MQKHETLTFMKIRKAIQERIAPLVYPDSSPVDIASASLGSEPVPFEMARDLEFAPFAVGDKWGRPWDTVWFRVKVKVPESMAGRPVRLRMGFSPAIWEGFGYEALAFAEDGTPITALNTNRDTIRLSDAAEAGESFTLYVEAAANNVSDGNDGRSIKRSDGRPHFSVDTGGKEIVTLDRAELVAFDPEAWSLLQDLRVLMQLAEATPQDNLRHGQLIRGLNEAVNLFDRDGRNGFAEMKSALAGLLAARNGSTVHSISAVGHAHIDTAWLWPLRETMRKCARTFSTVLDYMDEYPEFVFVCSQPVQYEWMKACYPAIYERIRAAVKRGQWEPVGSMWIEPDCNVPSGESLVRQILLGKRFFMREFDVETKDVWLPDVFGYSAALPQIMKKSGIDYFLTQKISWSQFNKFPHHSFLWEGVDGTEIFTHFPPADTYNATFSVKELTESAKRFRDHDRASHSLYVYGYGDGGGGPTREMLEAASRLKDLEGAPPVTLETASSFFEKASAESDKLARWVGELYLEYHRGTYTTHAAIKKGNRLGERLLAEAEFADALMLASGAQASGDPVDCESPARAVHDVFEHENPHARNGHAGALDRAWKLLLLNQFHDILPGSSINWVYKDAARDYATIHDLAARVREDAWTAMQGKIDTGDAEDPVLVVNSAGRERAEVIELPERGLAWVNAPALGYAVCNGASANELPDGITPVSADVVGGGFVIDNGILRVVIDANGHLTSVFDQWSARESVADGQVANVLQIHPDHPINFEAWDVDIFYREVVTNLDGVEAVECIESGPLRAVVRVQRRFGESSLTQDIVLRAGSRRIDFVTTVDWRERRKFLKVAFPVEVHADHATYEIQYGHLERPNHANTSWDMARFEVCGHRWADLSETGYGVALMNDCKYGYDIQGNVMRLSLLRGPNSPDPEADLGEHRFTYSLFPHDGDLRSAGVIDEAEALNAPLRTRALGSQKGDWPAQQSFVTLDRPNVSVEAFKVAEEGDALILRLVECHGARGPVSVSTVLPVQRVETCDLLERGSGEQLDLKDGTIELKFKPFEIKTLKWHIAQE